VSLARWRQLAGGQRFLRAPYAGLTSPAVRPSAAISPDERALTTLVSGCWGSAKCFVVAVIAASAVATATLKYLNDGGPRSAERRLEGDSIDEGCPGAITWTTQPAGGALSVMHATWRVSRTRVKAAFYSACADIGSRGLQRRQHAINGLPSTTRIERKEACLITGRRRVATRFAQADTQQASGWRLLLARSAISASPTVKSIAAKTTSPSAFTTPSAIARSTAATR
jgi:hypothetical protein